MWSKASTLAVIGLASCFACSSSSKNSTESGGGAGGSSATGGSSGATGSGGVSGASTTGCKDNSIEQSYGPNMVGCDGKTNQCHAEELCASGWHLCKYSEYIERGGITTKGTAERWLQACVRQFNDNNLKCPTDNELVCFNNCLSTAPSNSITVLWNCDQSPFEDLGQTNLGVIAGSILARPGCPTAECSYATVTEAASGLDPHNYGATCCK